MIGLNKEEIQVASKAYRKESQEIWDSNKPRQEKAELSMDLQSVYDRIAKAQLKKVVELLEDALENSFVMAYVGEEEPYESTIDPITIREIIGDIRQALLEEIKE